MQSKIFFVVGEAGNGLEAVQQVEALKPNVLILDLMMPDLGGLEVIRQVTKRSPETRIIVLSMYKDETYVQEALKYGAFGYVLKGDNVTELVRAVSEVSIGRKFLSTTLSENAIEAYVALSKSEPVNSFDTLTTREREVLHLSASGLTNSEIAEKLVISPRTVETHRANMMRKLGLQNQTDLIRYALRKGIIPPDE